MDLAAHVRVIWQNWWRILVISAVIAAGVYGYSRTKPNVYKSNDLIQVNVGRVSAGDSPLSDTNFWAQTYAKLATTPDVVRAAAQRSGLKIDVNEALGRASAIASADLGFVTVSATGPTPHDAAALARALGDQLIESVQVQQGFALTADLVPLQQQESDLRSKLKSATQGTAEYDNTNQQLQAVVQGEIDRRRIPTNHLVTVAFARPDSTPVAPKPARDAILAFLIAVVVTGELTVLIHYVGDRFSRSDDSSDLLHFTGLPVLAKIPQGSGNEVVEAFRILRTNLMFLEGAGKPRTLAIVSANSNAGKTFTSVNLAESAAALDEKVVLIDGDLHKPAVHERMGVERAPGLTAVLQGGDIASALRKTSDNPFLRVLPSGAPVQDPSAILGARAFRHVLDALRAVRLVVVDTPPGALFADAMAIASQCDATIFVIDVKTSRRRAVRSTLESLERAGANLVGLVVNRTATPRRAGYYES